MKKSIYIGALALSLLTASCSDFLDKQTPQGVLAILKIPEWTLEDVLGKRKTARQTDVKSDQKAAAKADTITDVR